MNKAIAGAGMLAVAAGVLVAGCSSAAPTASRTPAASVNADAGDCLFGVWGQDVKVGIANPTISCASWMHQLVGNGVDWYQVTQLARLGSRDVADTDKMGETCDLTDGKSELFVEDGGEMPYGDGTCTREEQAGWKPETTPGPLALQAQGAHGAQPAEAQASSTAASAAAQA